MAKYLIYKDGDDISYYRQGRNQIGGFATIEKARKAIQRSRKYRSNDTIKIFDTGKV